MIKKGPPGQGCSPLDKCIRNEVLDIANKIVEPVVREGYNETGALSKLYLNNWEGVGVEDLVRFSRECVEEKIMCHDYETFPGLTENEQTLEISTCIKSKI